MLEPPLDQAEPAEPNAVRARFALAAADLPDTVVELAPLIACEPLLHARAAGGRAESANTANPGRLNLVPGARA